MYKFLLFVILTINAPAFADDTRMTLSSQELYQGGVIHVKIHEKEGEKPVLKWLGKDVYLLHCPDKKIYEGFIAADLAQKPGRYDLILSLAPSGVTMHKRIKINAKDYGVRKLTLPAGQVDLSTETLQG
jgi:hypothetical protein